MGGLPPLHSSGAACFAIDYVGGSLGLYMMFGGRGGVVLHVLFLCSSSANTIQ